MGLAERQRAGAAQSSLLMSSSSTGMKSGRLLAARPSTCWRMASPSIVRPPGREPGSTVSARAEGLRERALGVPLPAASGRGVDGFCPGRRVAVPPPVGVGGTLGLVVVTPGVPPPWPTWLWRRARDTRRCVAGVSSAMMAAVAGHGEGWAGLDSWCKSVRRRSFTTCASRWSTVAWCSARLSRTFSSRASSSAPSPSTTLSS